ncbi:hypothetical protein ACVWW2_003696 [Bradyrhizobium sp. LM4.3]
MRPSVMSCAIAASRHHQDQRRDDRLHAKHRDEKSVPQAADQARAERGCQHHGQTVAVGEARRDCARDSHDRAD